MGAGTALPGIVAAKVGALVILTDSDDQPQVYVLAYAAACLWLSSSQCCSVARSDFWVGWDVRKVLENMKRTCNLNQVECVVCF